jgi:hypothetical protein
MIVYDGIGTQYGSAGATTNVDDGNWHFVLGEYDGNDVSIWVDGQRENHTTPGAFTLASSANSFEVSNCYSHGGFYNGTIDDVRVYNRALTTAEVKQLYKLGTTKISQ